MRIKVLKTTEVEPEDSAEVYEAPEISEAEQGTPAVDPYGRRLARIAYYSAAVCILAVILFAWLAGYYAIALETRISETTANTFGQMENRIAKLEAGSRPQPPRPTFVEFTPPDNAPRLGNKDAKVTIVEFADFQCPFCGRFHKDVYGPLIKQYVETGKAVFVYQDFAFLGEESVMAAEATKCAGEQGKFWEYHDYLFSHQNGENQGAFDAKNLKGFARALKLSSSAFNTCLDTDKYRDAVMKETASGRDLGITGTPTLVINGKVLVGALPYEQFKQAVEEALAK